MTIDNSVVKVRKLHTCNVSVGEAIKLFELSTDININFIRLCDTPDFIHSKSINGLLKFNGFAIQIFRYTLFLVEWENKLGKSPKVI